jgi:putative transcriptional regulator
MPPHSDLLTNQFLIAMPGMQDPNFHRTLTLLCEHSAKGAMGIVVNRPAELVLGDILDQLSYNTGSEILYRLPVYQGGPMQPERGFVIHNDASVWDSTLAVSAQISVTTSRDILEAIAKGEGPSQFLMALGYAGWGPGQLEHELIENVWLNGPVNEEILFRAPADQRLSLAASQLGIDFNLISVEAGHA